MLRLVCLLSLAVAVLGIPPVNRDHSTGRLLTLGCSEVCEDKRDRCRWPGMKSYCNQGTFMFQIRSDCPRLCGRCVPCNSNNLPCSLDCEDGNKWCPTMYKYYCNHPYHGMSVRKTCKKTCGMCKSCTPDKVPKCKPTCRDNSGSCKYWSSKMKFCEGSIYSNWMKKQCPLSCNECRRCPRPIITTRKPYITRPATTKKPYATRPSRTTRKPKTTTEAPLTHCTRGRTNGVSTANLCLDTHNYYRCLHGAQPLKYDYSLESSAQKYANKLPTAQVLEASEFGVDRSYNVGENLAWSFVRSKKLGVADAVAEWYVESFEHDYEDRQHNQDSERFTQLVWKDTRAVGCAVKKYKDETYVVAHYRTGGNHDYEYEDNVKKPRNDTCRANCHMGTCQANDAIYPDDCECSALDVPICYGPCVIKCERPYNHHDDWVDSCEGASTCTCSTEEEWKQGVAKGAVCR